MTEKHREVREWLETIYGEEPIPKYKVDGPSLDCLYHLMVRNKQQDHYAELLAADYHQKEEEYAMEASRIGAILQKLSLSPEALSQSGSSSLHTVASVALLLQTRDSSDSSLLLGITRLNQDKMGLQEARRREQKLSSSLISKTKDALLQKSSLKKALGSLEEQSAQQSPELQKKSQEAGFLQSKAKEYRKHAHKQQLELSKVGANPDIYHNTLVQLSEELEKSKEKLRSLRAKLDSYHSLPPDIALAKVKVEETRRQLAKLEEELAKQIDLMHT